MSDGDGSGRSTVGATSGAGARRYRMQKRREDVAETRRRIVDAAVELHGTVGPAQTTLSAIAERAGVQRSTLYRHFADEAAVFGACSGQWFEDHPWPDVAAWESIADPVERLSVGLRELYGYYDENRAMLSNVYRDMAAMPAFIEELMEAQVRATGEALLAPWPKGADRERLAAAVALAIDFHGWQVLDEAGMAPGSAAGLVRAMVAAVA